MITLENMYYADEIRPNDGIAKRLKVDKRELEPAEALIDRFTMHFDHGRYENEYQRRLRKPVRRKAKGEEIHAAAPRSTRRRPTGSGHFVRASRR